MALSLQMFVGLSHMIESLPTVLLNINSFRNLFQNCASSAKIIYLQHKQLNIISKTMVSITSTFLPI